MTIYIYILFISPRSIHGVLWPHGTPGAGGLGDHGLGAGLGAGDVGHLNHLGRGGHLFLSPETGGVHP